MNGFVISRFIGKFLLRVKVAVEVAVGKWMTVPLISQEI